MFREYFLQDQPIPWSEARGILRAATALDFSIARNFAISYLSDRWRDELDNVTARELSDAQETIYVARRYNAPNLLKRAMYEALRNDHTNKLSSNDRERIKRAKAECLERWKQEVYQANPEIYAPCPRAATVMTTSTDTPFDSSATSASQLECPSAQQKIIGWQDLTGLIYHDHLLKGDIIVGLQAFIDIDFRGRAGYCKDCTNARRDRWTKAREKIWSDLDGYFDLDSTE